MTVPGGLTAMMMGGAAGGGGIASLADLFTGQDGFAYEFDNLSTLWQDTSATTPVTTNGDPIARVDDVSGNGYNATQGTASAQPTFNDSAGIRWSGYDGGDALTIASSTASLAWLHKDVGFGIAALVLAGSSSNPDARYAILGNSSAGGTNTGIELLYDDRSSVPRNDNGVFNMRNGVTLPYNHVFGDDTFPANTTVGLVSNTPISGPNSIYINNALVSTSAKATSTSAGTAAFDFQIGSAGNNGAPMVGRIYQLVVRDEEFTPQELTDIQNYFLSKL